MAFHIKQIRNLKKQKEKENNFIPSFDWIK